MASDSKSEIDLYVFHRSYFCGKMMAYMRYKEIPHNTLYKSLSEIGDTLLEKTGLRVMPVVQLGDGRWMNDTTPMMLWFENKHTAHSVMPDDAVTAFFVRLLEDYADEWMWRPAINSRWENKCDRQYYEELFPREFAGLKGLPLRLASALTNRHMHKTFLEGDGITSRNREHVWSIYTDTLARLESIFQRQPFLLGPKPCLADFAFFGSMFWHFGSDPTPSRLMHEQAPGVYEWVGRMWNAKGQRYSHHEFDLQGGPVPPLWDELLHDVFESYLPYLVANARAYTLGKSRFNLSVGGYSYPGVQVSPYRVWCFEQLQGALFDLTSDELCLLQGTLPNSKAWDDLSFSDYCPSEYDPQGVAPFTVPGVVTKKRKRDFFLRGSSYITRRRAWDN